MKPDPDQMLRVLAQAMMTDLAPRIPDDYLQKNAMIMGMLLQSAAEEWDRAAARRVEENAALRRLFRGAADHVENEALRERLLSAGRGKRADLHIAALDRENGALRGLLVDLHSRIEALDSPAARRIEARIWAELRRSTERRALSIAPF